MQYNKNKYFYIVNKYYKAKHYKLTHNGRIGYKFIKMLS